MTLNFSDARRRCCLMLLAACVVAQAADIAIAAVSVSNSLLSFSTDGLLVACSNRDSATVTILEAAELKKRFETEVGLHPEGTTFVGDSKLLACCVYGTDQVVILDGATGQVQQRIDVFDEPYGVVSSADGKFLYVTLEYPGQVIRIRTADWTVDAEWNIGRMLRGIALTADQKHLYVTEYLTARLLEVSAATGELIREWKGTSGDNLSRHVALHPQLPKAYQAHIRSRITAAHGNGSIFPYVGVATLSGEDTGRRIGIPMDTFRGTRVVANPWEVAVSPDGQMAYVIFGGTNDMYAAKITQDGHQELDYHATLKTGSNPRAARITPDGKTLMVYNALDYELRTWRLPDLTEVGRVSITDHPLPEEIRLGKSLFYTALEPMSGRQWISCSSCHPDGDSDGRTWQQPEGLRQTQPMSGLAWTHPLHWSADRDEVQDFEHTIRGKLMQGQGLAKGRLPESLEAPITGLSKSLDAMAAYTNSHRFALSPHVKNGLNDAAKRGQQLFHSEQTGCATCHSGPFYSDSRPVAVADFKKHDVGTGKDDPSELMGPTYDTPTLLGIYRSGPYLHHGRAETLKDVLTSQNRYDQHGKTSQLTPDQLDDMVEFLKALPFEDPEPAARKANFRQITGYP